MSYERSFRHTVIGVLAVLGILLIPACTTYAQSGSATKAAIHLTILGRDGTAVVPNAAQMTVKLDKKPVKILSLRRAKPEKLVFAVAVDVSTSGAKKADAIRVAAAELFQALYSRGGTGYLTLFNQGVSISSRSMTPAEAQIALSHVVFRGGTALYDAMEKVTSQILSKQHNSKTRRVLVLVTDGNDDQSRTRMSDVEAAAEREGVAFFVLDPFSRHDMGVKTMSDACHATGGWFVMPGRHLEDGVAPLIAAIDQQWTLSVETPQSSDGKMHRLQVKTRQKHVRLFAPAHISLP